MLGIRLNKQVVDACMRAFGALAGLQSGTRKRLVKQLQQVCSKCDNAYSELLERLSPVKAAYRNPKKLAVELRSLAGDRQTRAKFKPEHLCSDIDQLIADFQNGLSGLKYSVRFFSLEELKDTLKSMGNYDQALYHQYDGFMTQMGSLATAIEKASADDRSRLADFARAEIAALERDLRDSIRDMRAAKDQIVRLM